jgi:eukaryotic-like serine/threonine-protein kinase
MSRWDLITDLLARASELPEGERVGWLRSQGEAEDVIEEVLVLLASWERDPHFLEIEGEAPEKLGPWRIVRELGHGGMGRVFEAVHEDATLNRRVAIKVIGARRFHPELVQGFLQERAILARLEHPGIARLYDTGQTPNGFPYFVMEFVDGKPIHTWIGEKSPALRQRVEIFVKLCEAISFAHRNLVVHGDLKPGNIFISADGQPRLLDFGIARVMTDDDSLGLPMLTPHHASPEQLAGLPITTASDVFQLGLLLRDNLAKPGSELEAMIAKCLRQRPEDRYASAEGVVQDLRAWLEHKPVSAMAPSWHYPVRKMIQRYPLGAALVLAVIVGLASVAWQANRAEQEKQRAMRQFEQIRKFSRSMLTEISDLPTAARKPIVERTAKLLDDFVSSSETDPVLLLELAVSWRALAAIQGLPTASNLGEFEESARSYDKAIAIAMKARQGEARRSASLLVQLYAEASRVQRTLGEKKKVEALTGQLALFIHELEAFGPSRYLAYGYSELAFFRSQHNRKEGMDLYAKAIQTHDALKDPELEQKAFALKRWGALLLAERQIEAGAQRYREALAIERASKDGNPFDMSFTLSDLGLASRLLRRYDEATALYQEALAIRQKAYEGDPTNMRALNGLASTHNYLGWVNSDAGRREESIRHARLAIEHWRLAAAPPRSSAFASHKIVEGHFSLAQFLRMRNAKGDRKEAAQTLEEARQILVRFPSERLTKEIAAIAAAAN